MNLSTSKAEILFIHMNDIPGTSIIIRYSEIFSGNVYPGIVLRVTEGGVQQSTKRKVQRITVLNLKKTLASASPVDSSGQQLKPC